MLIGVPEIERIGQACAHDLAVTIGDFRTAIACCDVRDQNELVRQRFSFALLAGDEAFLVGANGEADDFRRDCEEFFLKLAHQHDRPFNQTGYFFKQTFVFDQIETRCKGQIAGVLQDDFLAALGVEHHESLFKLFDIIIETAHFDRLTIA